jgi:hypothetical protein
VDEVVGLESIDFDLYRRFHAKPLCVQTPHHHFFIESVCRKAITTVRQKAHAAVARYGNKYVYLVHERPREKKNRSCRLAATLKE